MLICLENAGIQKHKHLFYHKLDLRKKTQVGEMQKILGNLWSVIALMHAANHSYAQ